MPATATRTEERTLKPITPEIRETLLKYFATKPPDKTLTVKEFDSIRPYLNRGRGGLAKEAYEMVKDDPEMVKAAAISQVQKDHRTMERRTPEIRETLLKVLRAEPGEKNLDMPDFKMVAVFLDRKNGGIRAHAFRLFKDDKEVLLAAEKHRFKWQEMYKEQDKSKANGKDPALDKARSDTEKAVSSVRARRGKQPGKELEPER